ncbi:hypothetical protein [Acaryochloris sp. 'Moss Beach']|uniref:hypothetical protein n=1 Tax=Acaryochloris sp. 'Moss Beach' TaxID=2740837 RepID=UPI001F2E3527|nr:hypothetical protein [Acaryochloris sp. 'Moss Beach']
MLGRTLGGRYQVQETLGGGSFGQTYLAVDIHRPDRPPMCGQASQAGETRS